MKHTRLDRPWPKRMQLIELVENPEQMDEAGRGVSVNALTADSRLVKPGTLFAALKGSTADGTAFIPDAIAAGASAILTYEGAHADVPASIAIIESADPRRDFALMAARFYGTQPETIAAVTGTAGKTSVADFTRQIWAHAGLNAASLGTLGLVSNSGADYGALTTPDPVALHERLADLAGGGITHLAMEASSHGIDQRRLDGVRLKAAGFTNIGRDHLDYHGTFEAYFAAKLRLFDTLLPETGIAVVDADRQESARVTEAARVRGIKVFSVGRAGDDLRLLKLSPHGFRQVLELDIAGERFEAALPLAGTFQVSNALVAAGLAMACGLGAAEAISALKTLKGAKGRLEFAGETPKGGLVFIDYSHKPDALEAALMALRPFVKDRLLVVFGAGGDRDPGKRSLMGAVAVKEADRVIVTDDNPRSEEPALIRRAILEAAPGAIEIGDRAEAIATAVDDTGPGDVLLIAGKGHETGQIIGDEVRPFSDHEAVGAAIARTRAS